MADRDIHLRELILNLRPIKVYGGLALIGAFLTGTAFLLAALLGNPVNYAAIFTVIGYVGFMFLRVYISRNHSATRERLKSAPDEEAWSVMSGGIVWGIPVFGILALVFYLTRHGLSG